MSQPDLFHVECTVLEILPGFGLAHLEASDRSVYTLNRQTPGIHFDDLKVGQRVRVGATSKFRRVWHAVLLRDR